MSIRRITLLSLLLLLMPAVSFAAIRSGDGYFTYTETTLTKSRPVKVYYYKPRRLKADSPVMIIMHGMNRNADAYRDVWIDYAKKTNTLIIAPEFSTKYYKGSSRYNRGNIYDSDKKRLKEKRLWAYMVVDDVFDYVVAELKLNAKEYDIYGHSAGSQFVHRLCFFNPEAKIRKAFAANAGWYIFPLLDVEFPYGFKNIPTAEKYIRSGFKRELIILLGTDDDDSNANGLRNTKEAKIQGKHRYARGQHFMATCKRFAAKKNIPLNWTLKTVDGVAHSNSGMAQAAMDCLRVGTPR